MLLALVACEIVAVANRQIRRLVLYVHGVVPSTVGSAQVRVESS
jgi:hypothetical protein